MGLQKEVKIERMEKVSRPLFKEEAPKQKHCASTCGNRWFLSEIPSYQSQSKPQVEFWTLWTIPSIFLLLIAMPFVPSSILATSSNARSYVRCFLLPTTTPTRLQFDEHRHHADAAFAAGDVHRSCGFRWRRDRGRHGDSM